MSTLTIIAIDLGGLIGGLLAGILLPEVFLLFLRNFPSPARMLFHGLTENPEVI